MKVLAVLKIKIRFQTIFRETRMVRKNMSSEFIEQNVIVSCLLIAML